MMMNPNGRLAINVADSGGTPAFKHQHYSDFPLITARPYHVMIDAQFGNHFDLWIDGEKQTSTHAGTLGTDTTMSTHSGDWSFGDPDGNLDTGGVDIAYNACITSYLAHWGTWSGVGGGAPLTTAEIQDSLFRDGALSESTITSGTQSAMQTSMDVYNTQTHADTPLTFDIEKPSSGTDLELELTDQIWPDEVKFQIRWMGTGALTIVNTGTSNFVASKGYGINGGTISVVQKVPVTVTVKDIADNSVIQSARVLVEESTADTVTITRSATTATVTHTAHGYATGDEVVIRGATQNEYNGIYTITVTPANAYTYTVSGSPVTPATGTITSQLVILNGVTDVSGQITTNKKYSADLAVQGVVRRATTGTKYRNTDISGTITSTGLNTTAFMIGDE